MGERQRCARLQRLDRDVAADLAHDGQSEQLADEEALIVFQLRHDHLKEVIGLAGNKMAGDNFRHCDHGALEAQRLLIGVAANFHADKTEKPRPTRPRRSDAR